MFPKMFRKFKKKSLLFFLVILWGQQLQAAFEPRPMGAWQRALGNAGLASAGLDFAAYNNPARLAADRPSSLALLYQNFFGLTDLNQLGLSVSMPLFGMGTGLDVVRLGNKTYSETTFSLAASLPLTRGFRVGVGFNTYVLEIKNYGRDTAFGLQLALQYRFSEQLRMAVVAGNLNEPRLGQGREAIPVFGRVGLAWQPAERVSLYLDALYERQWDAFFGLSFRLNDHFSLMTGTQNLTNSLSAGFMLSLERVHVGYALELHPELSYSHTVDIRYVF